MIIHIWNISRVSIERTYAFDKNDCMQMWCLSLSAAQNVFVRTQALKLLLEETTYNEQKTDTFFRLAGE